MTTTTSEFIFEDSEIPDLVLETIIGFVAEMTLMDKWGEIRCVSKRWNRISKPVLKEAFKTAWPKFILPRIKGKCLSCSSGVTSEAVLEISSDRSSFTRSDRTDTYRWALVRSLPLHSVVESKKVVGVTFVPSATSGVQIGCFLVSSPDSNFFDNELCWDPYSQCDFKLTGEISSLTFGSCGGLVISHKMAGTKADDYTRRTPGTRVNEPFDVTYTPGTGVVTFIVNGTHFASGTVQESEMMEKYRQTAVIVFGAASAADSARTLSLRPWVKRP